MIWFLSMLLAVILGVVVGSIRKNWSWLLIIPTPFIFVYLLLYLEGRKDIIHTDAPMAEITYFTVAVPAVILALMSWYIVRYYRQ